MGKGVGNGVGEGVIMGVGVGVFDGDGVGVGVGVFEGVGVGVGVFDGDGVGVGDGDGLGVGVGLGDGVTPIISTEPLVPVPEMFFASGSENETRLIFTGTVCEKVPAGTDNLIIATGPDPIVVEKLNPNTTTVTVLFSTFARTDFWAFIDA